MVEDPQPSRQEAVVVLVSEDFFCDRICATLTALGKAPVRMEFGDDLLERMLAVECLGVVVDLEDQNFDAAVILKGLRGAAQTDSWTFLTFCSHDDEERTAQAAALGLSVTPRSTFALNLVRRLQEFGADEEPIS